MKLFFEFLIKINFFSIENLKEVLFYNNFDSYCVFVLFEKLKKHYIYHIYTIIITIRGAD